eukprot:jgi/Mesvir1/21759/Mv04164-RA.1
MATCALPSSIVTRDGHTRFLGNRQAVDPQRCLQASSLSQRFFATHGRRRGVTVAALGVTSAPKSEVLHIREDLRTKRRSCVEIATEWRKNLLAWEPTVKSFLTIIDEKDLLSQARILDKMIADEGADAVLARHPMLGVPVGVKDNLCTTGVATTCGSKILEGYRPPYDAHAVAKLRAAGALIMGKTNMDEFGMGSTTENSAYQATTNPWSCHHVPGGSSGGSAAAVAARQVAAALGTDTGGSIRLPASFCGVVGLKPTYGRVSRYGLVAYASSLDAVGPMACTVTDAAVMMEAIAGRDARDPTSDARPVGPYAAGLGQLSKDKPLDGVRLGLVKETMGAGLSEPVARAIKAAAAHLESLGAVIVDASLPSFEYGLPAYYVIAPCEASSNLARYDGLRYGLRAGDPNADIVGMYGATRDNGFGPEVKRRILMGTYALSAGYYDAYYKRSQQVRTLIQRDFTNALSSTSALLCPVAPTSAYRLGEKSSDPLAMYLGDLMTVNVNLAGLPAISIPCGVGEDGMPIGMQLIGRAFDEQQLLTIAHAFEQTNSLANYSPPMLQPAGN